MYKTNANPKTLIQTSCSAHIRRCSNIPSEPEVLQPSLSFDLFFMFLCFDVLKDVNVRVYIF